jgi:predicted aldo/keto reductase-like oxidoreductase
LEKVELGSTGIEVSRLGIGTGTAHPYGCCAQALMEKKELAELLVYAFEHGITFWDTALQYETHAHIREALKHIHRPDVVITTKLVSCYPEETITMFNKSLTELGVDYVDVCLVHGVRTEREMQSRRGVLDALLECKKAGKLRAVGISSHGLGALKAVTGIPEIDLVWARINFAGFCMDPPELGLYDQLSSVAWIKKVVKKLLPKRIISAMRPDADTKQISESDRKEVHKNLEIIHSQSKGIVGMKVLAQGLLGAQAQVSIEYVKGLSFIDSMIIGMVNKKEVEENCRIIEEGGA